MLYQLRKVGQSILISWAVTEDRNLGAYILSPLEETSRDASENAGFVITWMNNNQTTRMTTYSLRNTPDPNSVSQPSTPAAIASKFPPLPAPLSRAMSTGRKSVIAPISNVLSTAQNTIVGGTGDRTFAAFKMLPIDPTRVRRTSEGGEYVEAANDYVMNGATNCREAVDLVVETIRKACADIGVDQDSFITDEDVVR
jgi:phosphatidylinositol 4-phosphatase